MLVHLIGLAKLDFMSDDGKPIIGTNLFVSFPDPNVIGQSSAKLFIGQNIELPANLAPGASLDIDFNNKGKVMAVKAAAEKSPGK
jgi:hypothetical protein